jgi:hypothetical protein
MELEIEIEDPAIKVSPYILINSLEARRKRERRNTPTDLEVTYRDSRFITKIPRKITSIAHEFHSTFPRMKSMS